MTRLALLLVLLVAGCSAQPAGNATPRAETEPGAGVPAKAGVTNPPAVLSQLGAPHERPFVIQVDARHDGGAPPLTPEVLAGGATPNRVVTGRASWYAARGDQGAVPWWKPGQEPIWAVVSRFADGRTYSVTVLITGWCGCRQGQPGARVIDLSDGAFRQLAPLSAGLIRVTVELTDAGPGLPATDVVEGSAP